MVSDVRYVPWMRVCNSPCLGGIDLRTWTWTPGCFGYVSKRGVPQPMYCRLWINKPPYEEDFQFKIYKYIPFTGILWVLMLGGKFRNRLQRIWKLKGQHNLTSHALNCQTDLPSQRWGSSGKGRPGDPNKAARGGWANGASYCGLGCHQKQMSEAASPLLRLPQHASQFFVLASFIDCVTLQTSTTAKHRPKNHKHLDPPKYFCFCALWPTAHSLE